MSKRTAFTLIELVVVIGIIAVIAAIITPVFANAKRNAKVEVGKQYLKQQFIALELYAIDQNGVYPGYDDVLNNKAFHVPCSPLYDWKKPCWERRNEIVSHPIDKRPSPMIGGRGYIYAIKDWQDIDRISADQFLGWDRTKPYPLLCDIFAARYRVQEFDGTSYDPTECLTSSSLISNTGGCHYPEVVYYAYSDGSLRSARQAVNNKPGVTSRLFDWVFVFTRQMNNDSRNGN